MTLHLVNVVGLGLNFLATILLLKYAPESKSIEQWAVTQEFEKTFIPEFVRFTKTTHWSILLLMAGFGFQFFAALFQTP
jgi:hypothetical protein